MVDGSERPSSFASPRKRVPLGCQAQSLGRAARLPGVAKYQPRTTINCVLPPPLTPLPNGVRATVYGAGGRAREGGPPGGGIASPSQPTNRQTRSGGGTPVTILHFSGARHHQLVCVASARTAALCTYKSQSIDHLQDGEWSRSEKTISQNSQRRSVGFFEMAQREHELGTETSRKERIGKERCDLVHRRQGIPSTRQSEILLASAVRYFTDGRLHAQKETGTVAWETTAQRPGRGTFKPDGLACAVPMPVLCTTTLTFDGMSLGAGTGVGRMRRGRTESSRAGEVSWLRSETTAARDRNGHCRRCRVSDACRGAPSLTGCRGRESPRIVLLRDYLRLIMLTSDHLLLGIHCRPTPSSLTPTRPPS